MQGNVNPMYEVKRTKFSILTVFEMTYCGQDNDLVNSSYSLTLKLILGTYWVHYLQAMPFLNFCEAFFFQKIL